MTNETKKEVDIAEFKSLVESNHKILGLDIGSKRIGVAISTSDMTGALPLRTIKYSNMKDFLKEINEIVKRHEVKALIIGLPLNMDGSEGPRCDSVRDFAHAMMRIRDIPVVFHVERLSTQAVESAMVEADMTRAKRILRRDALAAVWILQSALDRLHDNRITSTYPSP